VEHEDAFPPHRPNGGYVIGKETVAWARRSGRDEPISDLPAPAQPERFDSFRTFGPAHENETPETKKTQGVQYAIP